MEMTGSRLKEERRKKGLSQQEFASLGGVGVNAQWQYENGQRIPKADYLVALAQGGVDILYIVLGQRTPVATESLDNVELVILQFYRSLDARGKAAIERLLLSLSKRQNTGATADRWVEDKTFSWSDGQLADS